MQKSAANSVELNKQGFGSLLWLLGYFWRPHRDFGDLCLEINCFFVFLLCTFFITYIDDFVTSFRNTLIKLYQFLPFK